MKKLLKIVVGIAVVFVLAIGAVFYFTAGMAGAADEFFAAIKKQDIATARGYLSEDFKASTDETALKNFLTKGALLNFKETTWSSRQITGGRGELEGEVITESGGVVPLKLLFAKENDTWKIYGIQKPTAGLQTEQSSPNIPAKADQVALVKQAMHDFAVSVNNKSMEHFHSTVSQLWQREFTAQKFDEAFGAFFESGLDLTVLDGFESSIEPVAVDENGVLVLEGFFPTRPSKVTFKQQFVYEGIGWKLVGFKVNVNKA
jgi:hypothetical protein